MRYNILKNLQSNWSKPFLGMSRDIKSHVIKKKLNQFVFL